MQLDPNIEQRLESMEVRSNLRDAKKPEEIILRRVRDLGYGEDATFAIKLALEEAMTNAVKHGNRNDESKTITIRYCVTPDVTAILIRDQGSGFEPDDVPDPTTADRISLPHGRGLMLMRAYMNDVWYQCGGAEVCMVKRREA